MCTALVSRTKCYSQRRKSRTKQTEKRKGALQTRIELQDDGYQSLPYRLTHTHKKKKEERRVWVLLRRESKHRGWDNQETGKMKLHIQVTQTQRKTGENKGDTFSPFPHQLPTNRLSRTVLSGKPRGSVACYAAPTTQTAQRRKNNSSHLITSKTIKKPQKKAAEKRKKDRRRY